MEYRLCEYSTVMNLLIHDNEMSTRDILLSGAVKCKVTDRSPLWRFCNQPFDTKKINLTAL